MDIEQNRAKVFEMWYYVGSFGASRDRAPTLSRLLQSTFNTKG
jgi:hypothetical protein